MSLTLSVDGARWRRHLVQTTTALPGIVPVAKGNGYGFGINHLARRCTWLDEQADTTGSPIDMMAVGTYLELQHAAPRFAGDLLVLTPWRPLGAALDVPETLSPRVIHTVSRTADVRDLLERAPDARFVLEQLTSMRRHGMTRRELLEAAKVLGEQPAVRAHGRGDAPAAQHRQPPRRGHPAPQRRRRHGPADAHHLRQPPDRPPSWPGCARPTPTSRSGRGSAPTCGSATAGHCGSAPPSWTCTPSSAARRSAIAAGRCPRAATSWSSAAAPLTGSGSRRRSATSPCAAGPRPSHAAAWTWSAWCDRRSRSTASSGCSRSPRTCRPRCCSCRQGRACPRSARTSTSASGSPPPRSTGSTITLSRCRQRSIAVAPISQTSPPSRSTTPSQ